MSSPQVSAVNKFATDETKKDLTFAINRQRVLLLLLIIYARNIPGNFTYPVKRYSVLLVIYARCGVPGIISRILLVSIQCCWHRGYLINQHVYVVKTRSRRKILTHQIQQT